MLRTLRNLVILVVVVAVTRTCIQHFGERKLAKAVEKANAEMPIVVTDVFAWRRLSIQITPFGTLGLSSGTIPSVSARKTPLSRTLRSFIAMGEPRRLQMPKYPLNIQSRTQTDTLAVSVTPDKCR
jgi:hypothetical protein